MQHPFIRQIDHVAIQTARPAQLFDFFTNTLGLPVAFPYAEYNNYWSGAVGLGNMYLEIMRFVSPYSLLRTKPATRYHILGFLVRNGTMPQCVADLEQRQIPHGGIVPFFAPEATDAHPIRIWENVYLGDLLGSNRWLRILFASLKLSQPKPSSQRSKVVNALVIPLLQRAFRTGMAVLTDYHRDNDDAKRAADADQLQACGGGGLGILGVQEIEVSAPNSMAATPWQQLLNPLQPDANKRWELGCGPAIKLVPGPAFGIQTMVLTVASLARAQAFITNQGLTSKSSAGHISLTLPNTDGLTVELVE